MRTSTNSKIRRGCLSVLAAGCAAFASTQAAADDAQLWTALFVNGPVAADSRLMVWFDGHARFRDDVERLGVSILRPGVGWRLDDNGTTLWAGYARVVSRSETAPNVEENRLWQQATYRIGEASGFRVSGRTRLEQRFVSTGDDTGWRLRQFVRAEKKFGASDFSMVGWNETFFAFNDTDWGARSGYDQNRAFIGAGWQAAKNWRLEGGYLFNHIRRANAPDALNHALSLSISASL